MAKVVLPLEHGDKGRFVHDLQVLLRITHDGDFGPKTEAAVKSWQRTYNTRHKVHLIVDGIVGPKTWAAMHPVKTIVSKPPVVPHASALSPGEAVIVRYWKFILGGKYVFGAEVKVGDEWRKQPLDCSEATQTAGRLAHAAEPRRFPILPDGSYNQHAATKSIGFGVTAAHLAIGDLCFLHNGGTDKGLVHHVGQFIGGITVGEAKGHAFGIVFTTVSAFNKRGADWHRYRKVA
jgi:hypothetical protein